MSPWGWPRGLLHNLQIHKQGSKIQEHPSSIGVLQPYFKSSEGISCTSLNCSVPNKICHQFFQNSLIEFLHTDLDRNLVPSSLDLTSHNKAGLHQTFQKSLVEFLCTDFPIEFLHTDLDGNLSFTLNPLTASKLDHFLLTLPEGLPETANEDDKECHQHVWHKKRKHSLVDQIVGIALSATQIPYPCSQIYSTRGFKSIQC